MNFIKTLFSTLLIVGFTSSIPSLSFADPLQPAWSPVGYKGAGALDTKSQASTKGHGSCDCEQTSHMDSGTVNSSNVFTVAPSLVAEEGGKASGAGEAF